MKPESILWQKFIPWLAALAMLAFANCAQASVDCTISSGGFATAYGSTLNITAASFTVTCTKTPGNPKTATYQVAADNGVNFLGVQNRAFNTPSYLNYNLASDPGCLTPWKGTSYIPATPYTTPVLNINGATDIKTYSFYGCVPANQTAVTAGTYTDTVAMSFFPGGAKFINGTFPVSITAPATCTIPVSPGNITFNYTSFSVAAVLSNTSFQPNCTNLLPYTMALDVTSGTIVGLNYTLALNTTPNTGGTSPLSSTGTGINQTFYVNGSIAAGQAGTCAAATCAGSQTHTLTITY